jgi:hypothetical protein
MTWMTLAPALMSATLTVALLAGPTKVTEPLLRLTVRGVESARAVATVWLSDSWLLRTAAEGMTW